MRKGAGGLSHVLADKLKDCEKHPLLGNECSASSCLTDKTAFKRYFLFLIKFDGVQPYSVSNAFVKCDVS